MFNARRRNLTLRDICTDVRALHRDYHDYHDSGNAAETRSVPRTVSNSSVHWRRGDWTVSLFPNDPEQVGVEPIGIPVTLLDSDPAVASQFQDGHVPFRAGDPIDRIGLVHLKK